MFCAFADSNKQEEITGWTSVNTSDFHHISVPRRESAKCGTTHMPAQSMREPASGHQGRGYDSSLYPAEKAEMKI